MAQALQLQPIGTTLRVRLTGLSESTGGRGRGLAAGGSRIPRLWVSTHLTAQPWEQKDGDAAAAAAAAAVASVVAESKPGDSGLNPGDAAAAAGSVVVGRWTRGKGKGKGTAKGKGNGGGNEESDSAVVLLCKVRQWGASHGGAEWCEVPWWGLADTPTASKAAFAGLLALAASGSGFVSPTLGRALEGAGLGMGPR